MNCQNFEMVINDLARNQIMDAGVKTIALAHRDACARCAARLDDERALTKGLNQLAAGMRSEACSPRIEEMLRAALREKKAAVFHQPRRFARKTVAAAAAVILAAVALIVALTIEKSPAPAQAIGPAQAQPSEPKVAAAPERVEPALKPDYEQAKPVGNDSARKVNHNRRARTLNQMSKSRPDRFDGSPATIEIATDFIPLVQGESLSRMDGGQVVRVEMPRSALLAYGLPMNMERADERIKADLVIGNDGLARAIRFVR